MTQNCRKIYKSEGCCRRDKNMIKCATAAINQMKTMFDTAWCPIKEKPEKHRGKYNGCVIDPVCNIRECPFRGTGVAPNVLKTYCTKSNERTGGGVADRDAMRLNPGDVGLRGDRATFSLGRDPGLVHYDETTSHGAVYYNMRPNGLYLAVDQDDEQDGDNPGTQQQEQDQDMDHDQDQDLDRDLDQDQDIDPDQEHDNDQDQQVDESGDQQLAKDRKHVMEKLPASVKPTLGPVTGLPVSDDEHVFVLWLGKRPGEPDEKARLQIEVRVPKWVPEPEPVPSETMVVEVPPEVLAKSKGGKKKKRGSSKKSNSSKKSGGSKKSGSSKK
ncbi:uncharacterized protein LOC100573964 [Acyrthosiphon pisum]|uniref:Uncharacterized protein n=1 Tax=Acyrthosiphon pisum TaxID=7029 RepID=A0A8R1W413_ACYPI|nr:uncharacterized protein LOC100573964 [Acyrthosiphon pisum]|eukprot:XP_003240749.1 PREDICTED: uncharacterized protein LOC100573964 [Acyrthosiphon pisum]